MGSWLAAGMGFRTITVDPDGSFASHLRERPFSTGTWKLVQAEGEYRLELKSPAAGDATLRNVHRQGDSLFVDLDGKTLEWRRYN